MVHNKATPPLASDIPVLAATVVWFNSMSKESRLRALPLLRSIKPVLLVASYKLRAKLQKLKWTKVASFPVQARLMLAANQYDFTPKASNQILEVWANRAAAVREHVKQIGSFTMPEEPLKAIDSMSTGRWGCFQAQAQDF